MTRRLFVDFETRSALDLKEVGLDNYVKHPSTGVWCMAWAFDDEDVKLAPIEEFPIIMRPALARAITENATIVAHNAPFEVAVWNEIMVPRYNWPRISIDQCVCTMAGAYSMALPGDLEGACMALGLEQQKDAAGKRLMLTMARPRRIEPDGTIIWWDDEERKARLYEYCKQDVRSERELFKHLMPLSEKERRIYLLDQKINSRGVCVNTRAVETAMEVARREQERLANRFFEVTGGEVPSPSASVSFARWIENRGVPTGGVAKQDVVDLLAQDGLPDDVREALLIRQDAAKSSVAKLRPMVAAASADNRLRGMFQYHGASTGRWAGRRVQLQNLPRPKLDFENISRIVDMLERMKPEQVLDYISIFYGSPLAVISDCLRSVLHAGPGQVLITGDFANIEGRGLAWLAGEEWKLGAFRAQDAGNGPEIYLLSASRIYGVRVETLTKKSPERLIGKVCELALGYQGWIGAFQRMAATFGVKVPDETAERVARAWREAHPYVVAYWRDLEQAAIYAVQNPGEITSAGAPGRQVRFRRVGSFLWCLLPSGRALCYPFPELQDGETPWGEIRPMLTYMGENTLTRKWERLSTYGGKWAENVTQAICRDAQAEAMLRVDAAGLPIILHAHDEIVVEVDAKNPMSAEEYCGIMAQSPEWAGGFPIVVDGWRGKRYRKA